MSARVAAGPVPVFARGDSVFTRAVMGITALNFIFFTGYLFFFPTLPFFVERLGGSQGEIGLLIGVSSLTSMLVRPFVGYLVDSVGRRPLLVGGLVGCGVTALLYNLAIVPAAVFPLRVLTGASLATVVTAASTYVADVAPAGRRSEVMGYYSMANSLAFAVGPALGGYIIHADSIAGFDGFLVSHAGWTSGARTGELHFATLFLTAGAIAFMAAVAATALPAERRAVSTAIAAGGHSVFRRAALFPAAINATGSFGFAALVAFMPLFARDHGIENPGSLFVAYAAALIALRLTVGRRLEHVPRELAVLAGLAFVATALGLLATIPSQGALFAACIAFGMGAGLYQPGLMAYLVDRIDPSERGRSLGTFTLGADVGLSTGAFLLGFVIESAGYGPAFAIAAIVAASGAVAMAAKRVSAGR